MRKKTRDDSITPLFTYEWSGTYQKGSGDVSAQVVGEYLERFGERIVVDDIMADAVTRNSPLRHCFTWDDATAAASWRRNEARQVLNHLYIRQGSKTVPAYESVVVDGERAYVPRRKVTGEQLTVKARKELAAWVRRYAEVKSLDRLVSGVHSVLTDEIEKPAARRRRA